MKKAAVLALVLVLCALPVWGTDSEDILGEIDGSIYRNMVMGAEAKFGDKWRLLSREEIAALAGAVSSTSPGVKEILEKNIPLFVAMAGGGIMNVNITIDSINDAGRALIATSRDLFADLFMDRAAEGMKRSNEQQGLEDSVIKKITVRFLDEECPALSMTATYRKVPMFQKQVMFLTNNYIFNVTATSVASDKTDEILSLFLKSDSN